MFNLPADAIAAIDRGDVIDAIQRVRAQTGLGLKEAKDAVDRYRNGDRSALASVAAASAASAEAFDPSFASSSGVLPAAAAAALARGRTLEAVKLVREATGLGFAEAKQMVDAHRGRHVSVAGGARSVLGDPMAEPGRVRSGPWRAPLAWLVGALIVLLLWLVFGRLR